MADETIGRRNFLTAAGGTVATASVAGCFDNGNGNGTGNGNGNGQGSGETLIYARGAHDVPIDPQQTTSGEVSKVTNQIFDTLVKFEPGSGGQLTAGLATDYGLDGQTASLTLREGVTFHNGEEFTAEDFEATYRRFVDSSYDYTLGPDASGYGPFTLGNWIDSVEVAGDYELNIELSQQYAPFLRNLAMFATAVMSKAQIEGDELGEAPPMPEGDEETPGDNPQTKLGNEVLPVGTGPFEAENIDNQNQRIQLTATDEYFNPGPSVGGVVFKTIKQNSTRAAEVVNGDSHVTDNLDSQSSQQIDGADQAELIRKDGINVGYMAFNMERKEAFRDVTVRRAISLAVNTEAIVNDIFEGFAAQADQPLPPDVLGHSDDLDPYPHDPDQAQAMLEDAGYSDLSFELATFTNPRGYNPSPTTAANQVKSDLGEIGVEVTINEFSQFGSKYIPYVYDGKHDAAFLGWYTDNADPDNFLFVLLDPGVDVSDVPSGQEWVSRDTEGYSRSNISTWANTDFMEKVREGQRTYDEGQRRSLYEDATAIANDRAPWVFIDYAETLRGVNDALDADNYPISSVGGPFLNRVEFA
jgi:peptide/nickel transport system substrate-binding protein